MARRRKSVADPYAGIIRTGSTGQSQIPPREPPRQQKAILRQEKVPRSWVFGGQKGDTDILESPAEVDTGEFRSSSDIDVWNTRIRESLIAFEVIKIP